MISLIFAFLISVCSRSTNGSGTSVILAGRMIILGQRSDGRSHLLARVPPCLTHTWCSRLRFERTLVGPLRPRLDALYTWAFSWHRDVGGIVLHVCAFNRPLENVSIIIIIIVVQMRSQRYLCPSKMCPDVKIVKERILGDWNCISLRSNFGFTCYQFCLVHMYVGD